VGADLLTFEYEALAPWSRQLDRVQSWRSHRGSILRFGGDLARALAGARELGV